MVSKINSWPEFRILRCACTLLFLLALLLATPTVWAGKYAYGRAFVRVGESWADGGPVPGQPESGTGAAQDEGQYQRQVDELEDEGGPYADALAEPLTGLGRHYRQRGDMAQALRLYRRALHVVRVNDGLYSERQMPILRELLDAYRVSGEMEILDDRYNYYFRLYGNGQPPYTGVRLRAALAYLRWQREVVRLELDENEDQRILALYHLNDELLQAVAAEPSVALQWYRDLVLSQMRNLYLLEDRFAPTVQNTGLAPSTPVLAGKWEQKDFDKKRLELIQRGALSQGAGLLQALIDRTVGTAQSTELARLHLELGDWYQWHGKYRRAGEQYQQVVQLLSQESRADLLQQWLGQPRELPDNGAFWQFRPAQKGDPPVVVSVRYDVSARGRASNMQAGVSDPANEGLASRLKRKLAKIRFRPRWVSGVAEPVSQVQRDYQLIN
jgi:tetratricopeptide (TPR) repeat protein